MKYPVSVLFDLTSQSQLGLRHSPKWSTLVNFELSFPLQVTKHDLLSYYLFLRSHSDLLYHPIGFC